MRHRYRAAAAAATVISSAALGATIASAAPLHDHLGPRSGPAGDHLFGAPGPGGDRSRFGQGAVFVQTNNLAGNAIAAFRRAPDGTLSAAGTYPTGGLGGRESEAEVDYLASQDSLVYDRPQSLLIAVNAGSNTISLFTVRGTHLFLREILPSGGLFPTSVAIHDDLVYVLNAGGAGSVSGYRLFADTLAPIPGSTRSLGLANANPPKFLEGPGEVDFTPDGRQLLVATKASTSTIDSYQVGGGGLLAASPTATTSSTPVPFSFSFTPGGQLVVAQAGSSSLATYALGAGGTLSSISAVADNQAALCWLTATRGYYYVANAGSANVSAYTISPTGIPTLVGPTGVVASTDAGPIDMVASADGEDLYVQAGGAGAVDEFHVNDDGSLTALGSVSGLGTGIEGIAAS